mgnify:CR=1 FL=1
MSKDELQKFLKAADEFTRKATVSPEKARAVLVEEGIYKRDGQLTDSYK